MMAMNRRFRYALPIAILLLVIVVLALQVDFDSKILKSKLIQYTHGNFDISFKSKNVTKDSSSIYDGLNQEANKLDAKNEVSSSKDEAEPQKDTEPSKQLESKAPGFEKWLEFAKENKCLLTASHYAQLYQDLEPWTKLGKIPEVKQFQLRARYYTFKEGKITNSDGGNVEDYFQQVAHLLPNKEFTFAVNGWDEPISIPASDDYTGAFHSVKDAIEHNACLDKHPAKEYHGFLMSPDTFPSRNALVPVFSQAKISCFKDILVPLNYHYGSSPPSSVPWDQKKNILFWRGSTTGGSHRTGTDWRKYHRSRLVKWAINYAKTHPENVFDAGKDDMSQLDPSRINVDIGFHATVQTDPKTDSQIKVEYGMKSSVSFDETLKFKYLIVVDGNTWPARLQNYLQTGSVILFNGIFMDWFIGQLVPWKHYIPIAYDFSDLEDRIKWLQEHDDEARQIALNGMEFMKFYSRRQDMLCYTGLALLEYSNLYNES